MIKKNANLRVFHAIPEHQPGYKVLYFISSSFTAVQSDHGVMSAMLEMGTLRVIRDSLIFFSMIMLSASYVSTEQFWLSKLFRCFTIPVWRVINICEDDTSAFLLFYTFLYKLLGF